MVASSSFPYINGLSEEIRAWMEFVSTCREPSCLVAQRHPFYPVPNQPPLFHGPRPVMPVVPTNLATRRIMMIGEYPNTRFGTAQHPTTGKLEKFVPVSDINEPFEGGRYWDGHSIRDYPTFDSLQHNYLEPLGINLRSDIWMTNINKCHLLRPDNINTYVRLGWDEPRTEASFVDDNDYMEIASVCVPRHLPREIELCQPQLIILMGEKAYRMVHGSDDYQTPAPDIVFGRIVGEILRANTVTHELDTRNALFRQHNVVHLYHPSFFIRGASQAAVDQHHNVHIPAVKAFLESINLS